MNKHSWRWLLVLVIGVPAFSGFASGQAADPSEHKSHRAIPLPQGVPPNPDELWRQRFGEAREDFATNPLVQQILQNKELLKELQGMMQESQKSGTPPSLDAVKHEHLKELIRQWSEQGKIRLPGMDEDLRPEQLEAVKKKLEEKIPMGKLLESGPSSPLPGSGGQGSPSITPSRGQGPEGSPADGRTDSPPGQSGQPETPTEDLPQRWLRQLAERIPEMDPELARSPTFQRLLRKLSRASVNQDKGWSKWNELGERWNKLPEWVRSPQMGILRPERGLPFGKGLMPSFGRLNGPGKWFSRSPRGFGGGFPSGGPARGNDGWNWLLLLVVALLGGLVAWRMLRWRQEQAVRGAARWRLGPWPVDPAKLSTRDQIVQAFEYLSLLRLGPAARHQNHRQIAEALSKDEADSWAPRHQAAEHLAAVYEQARYAPAGEPVSETDLAAARREICLLAGVSGA